jgi:hypothetical protein
MLRVQLKKLQDLPSGGCPYCTRAHSNWSGFDQDVDDVVPLAHKPWGQPVSEGQDRTEKDPACWGDRERICLGTRQDC